jgi:hypothetical protein
MKMESIGDEDVKYCGRRWKVLRMKMESIEDEDGKF